MTFVNFALLGGAGLIAIPIVLHLIMRQKPKLLEFPALRFIQRRHDTNQRKLRLRHLLLLLLRAGAIALLALALARPSIKFSSRLGTQEAPVAAALIFDTAPHMLYRHDKRTRLDVAEEMGQWLLTQLPPESQIAVFDWGMALRTFDADRGLSKQRVERLEASPNPKPLSSLVSEATLVLQKSPLAAKEIYVFTDKSRASWRADESARLQESLRKLPGVSLYLIDVGVDEPSDFGLGDLHLSNQAVAAGGSVEIQTDIASLGSDGERAVELDLITSAGTPQKLSEQIVRLKGGESQTVNFRLPSLKPGSQQGTVRIIGEDALPADDVRYFSIEVRQPWPVLVVANSSTSQTAVYLTDAISPAEARMRHEAHFDCRVIGYGEFSGQALDKFAAVCLLDPPALEPGVWQRLADYAAAGHGVGIFLGRHAQPIDAFNSPAAQQLLPGKLIEQVPRPEADTHLAPQNYQHPILRKFKPYATRSPWSRFPIYRYWRIADLDPGSSTVIAYNDGRPALLERTIGAGRVKGHVLMMSTPFSDLVGRRDAWNGLPGSTEMTPWPFVMLADQIMLYLVGSGERQLNYFAGANSVSLPIDEQGRRPYLLTRPDGASTTLAAPEKAELLISAAEQVGNYQVHSVGDPIEPDRGFSVNLPAQTTQLSRLTEQELSDIFGPYKPLIARSSDQIVRDVHDSRVGREIYPWLILVFAGLLAIEYVVSSWFYKQT